MEKVTISINVPKIPRRVIAWALMAPMISLVFGAIVVAAYQQPVEFFQIVGSLGIVLAFVTGAVMLLEVV